MTYDAWKAREPDPGFEPPEQDDGEPLEPVPDANPRLVLLAAVLGDPPHDPDHVRAVCLGAARARIWHARGILHLAVKRWRLGGPHAGKILHADVQTAIAQLDRALEEVGR